MNGNVWHLIGILESQWKLNNSFAGFITFFSRLIRKRNHGFEFSEKIWK